MRVAVIIPDRGDRPEFMANCLRMMNAQTKQPIIILNMSSPPKTLLPDITLRYRIGYEYISKANDNDIDVIAFIENDDWYSPEYLEYMCAKWEEAGRPDLFGPRSTIYYHLGLHKRMTMWHDVRASAMNTLIKPNLTFNWPLDHDPYTDQWLWMNDNGIKDKKTFKQDKIVCIGMKHGVGKCGGEMHTTYLHRYEDHNDDETFLQTTLDEESFKFYSNYQL